MKELNYEELQLMCGIEIHQQLEGKKLFCDTPAQIRDDKADFVVSRKLRAVMGESGKLDIAAVAEMKKDKTYEYEGYYDTIGLVELDEEPPHMMNKQAFDTVTQVAKMLNSDLVDEVQVMRKTVVDGSNTSGFQRTALVGQDGYILTKDQRKITIPTVIIEEDACKIVKKEGKNVRYNLSRLGIPLIEIGTGPDITHPLEAKEVAAKLGMILRSTGKVKRGLGTIRQDVNVSIKKGNRVEIKGAQDLGMIPTIMDYEIIRQLSLYDLQSVLQNVPKQDIVDVTHLLKETECSFIAKAIKQNKFVIGVKLVSLAGKIGQELQPGKRLGTDFSDFAKITAGVTGLIHSDEDFNKYHISQKEQNEIKKAFDIKENDAFVLVVDKKDAATLACESVFERINLIAQHGVVSEVRKANPDGTSSYMRPMPGEARMYPETDTIALSVNADEIELPELLDAKAERFIGEYKLVQDLANMVVQSGDADIFEDFAKRYTQLKPSTIAECMFSIPKQVSRKEKIELELQNDDFEELFSALEENKIAFSSVADIFLETHKQQMTVIGVLPRFELLSDEDVQKIVDEVLAENAGAPFGALMGKVMAKAGGKADGKKVGELIKQKL